MIIDLNPQVYVTAYTTRLSWSFLATMILAVVMATCFAAMSYFVFSRPVIELGNYIVNCEELATNSRMLTSFWKSGSNNAPRNLTKRWPSWGGLASTDPLTELPNQRSYLGRLDEAIAFWRRRDIPVSVILLDIYRFKALNDTYGHQAVTLFWSLWRKFSAKLRPKSIFRPVWGGKSSPSCYPVKNCKGQ